MSQRLRIHTKHVIEYGDSAFAHKDYKIWRLLKKCGCDICTSDYDNDPSGCEWEISDKQFIQAIENLKSLPETDFNEIMNKDADYKDTKEDIIKILENFRDNGDSSDGFYHMTWL